MYTVLVLISQYLYCIFIYYIFYYISNWAWRIQVRILTLSPNGPTQAHYVPKSTPYTLKPKQKAKYRLNPKTLYTL